MPNAYLQSLLTVTIAYVITDSKEMVITVLRNPYHVLKLTIVTFTQLVLTTNKREDLYVCVTLDMKEMDTNAK